MALVVAVLAGLWVLNQSGKGQTKAEIDQQLHEATQKAVDGDAPVPPSLVQKAAVAAEEAGKTFQGVAQGWFNPVVKPWFGTTVPITAGAERIAAPIFTTRDNKPWLFV